MKLVVGLGNPGRRYAQTRHNVGFLVVERLAERIAAATPRERFQGLACEGTLDGHRLLLLCPQTYMNRSGSSVAAARAFYKIEDQDLIVVCDDFNLPLAKLRFRGKGSSGGQKGLQDCIRHLGSDQFARLRIGIGPSPDGWDVADYVLSKFSADDGAEIQGAVDRAVDGLAEWTRHGVQHCMNQYNAS